MPLPDPSGEHRVGVFEADIAAPTMVGVIPCVVYYPARPPHGDAATSPSTTYADTRVPATDAYGAAEGGLKKTEVVEAEDEEPLGTDFFCGVGGGRGGGTAKPPLKWLEPAYASALGRSHLTNTLGRWTAETLMSSMGPAATAYETVRAAVDAPAKTPPAGGWPCAIFSHSMTGWRHVNSSFCAEIASHGAVAIHVEHCDGTACLARARDDGRVLADYVSWEHDKTEELKALHGPDAEDEIKADLAAWRRGQLDARLVELAAALDGLDGAALEAGIGAGLPFARTSDDVAVLGQSFGGAAAAAMCARDDARTPRFSRCLVYDPWFDGAGDERYPLAAADYAGAFPGVKTAAIWRNGTSPLSETCAANWDAFLDKAGPAGRAYDHPHAGHFAQTDAPCVFERGPLSFVYNALVDAADGQDAATQLAAALEETVEALGADWFAAGATGPADA